MSRALLSPDHLMHESFKHSQGSVRVQVDIFRYFEELWDFYPNLYPSQEVADRYRSYLATSNNRTHIVLPPDLSADNAFEEVQSKYEKSLITDPNRSIDDITTAIASNLLRREVKFLSPWDGTMSSGFTGWATEGPQERRAKLNERMKVRIQAGKASFLFSHGFRGVSTNSEQFDQMYQDVWQKVEEPEKLEALVHNAEVEVLGEPITIR